MPIYNKLVRDKIPDIIEKTGKRFTTRVLNNEEYIEHLRKKAFEELEEYLSAQDDESAIEELADVLEIIHALAEYHGASINKIEEVRVEKVKKRGSFKERIFLIEVEDE
jgi:predicted house-cleaning noncanonical NTP pyrophosphatase (MazG superfamily)